MPAKNTSEKITARLVLNENGCWDWPGKTPDGYGRARLNGAQRMVHRIVWEHLVGQIPDGMELDHLCRNRRCANPAHLEPVTPWVNNVVRSDSPAARNARKTECINGHPFDRLDDVRRRCSECQREWSRRYYHRQKAKAS